MRLGHVGRRRFTHAIKGVPDNSAQEFFTRLVDIKVPLVGGHNHAVGKYEGFTLLPHTGTTDDSIRRT